MYISVVKGSVVSEGALEGMEDDSFTITAVVEMLSPSLVDVVSGRSVMSSVAMGDEVVSLNGFSVAVVASVVEPLDIVVEGGPVAMETCSDYKHLFALSHNVPVTAKVVHC